MNFKIMKINLLIISALSLSCLPLLSLDKEVYANENKAILTISGMTCSGCSTRIKRALRKIKNIKNIKISIEKKQAIISFVTGDIKIKNIIRIIEKLGYKVSLKKKTKK